MRFQTLPLVMATVLATLALSSAAAPLYFVLVWRDLISSTDPSRAHDLQ